MPLRGTRQALARLPYGKQGPDVVGERLDLGPLIAGQREQDDVPGAGVGESL